MGCVPFDPDYTCCEGWGDLDPSLADRSTTLAWSTVRALTAGRLGNCPTIVRPCLAAPCLVCHPWARQWVTVGLRTGEWVNCLCGTPECTCARLCEIVLPGEVAAILRVTMDGVELPLEAFRVDNMNRIVRTDGECWPSCQDMSAGPHERGTLAVEYLPGILPDEAGLAAVGVLACEFSKACSGAKCRLPSGVTAVARQGVSFQMSSKMFPDGMTGIKEVDAWLVSVNPHGHLVPPLVWSPDVPWAKHRYPSPTATIVP